MAVRQANSNRFCPFTFFWTERNCVLFTNKYPIKVADSSSLSHLFLLTSCGIFPLHPKHSNIFGIVWSGFFYLLAVFLIMQWASLSYLWASSPTAQCYMFGAYWACSIAYVSSSVVFLFPILAIVTFCGSYANVTSIYLHYILYVWFFVWGLSRRFLLLCYQLLRFW